MIDWFIVEQFDMADILHIFLTLGKLYLEDIVFTLYSLEILCMTAKVYGSLV